MANGFVRLYRQIQQNWVWADKPFSRGQAWIDLILLANYADGEMFTKGRLIKIKRGQVFRTIGFLSNRWGWNAKKTRRFLVLLEEQKMVSLTGTPQGTLITIEKYSDFQPKGQTKGKAKGQARGEERKKNKEKTEKPGARSGASGSKEEKIEAELGEPIFD